MSGSRFHKSCITLLLAMLLAIVGCQDIYDQDKYQRPDWLEGKLYTQLSQEEDLLVFKECLELSGYDTIIDRTGSYTVFAPNDKAFDQYFKDNPEYMGDPKNIPLPELVNLVRIHIIQDAWTKNQIQLLDVGGWIDRNDPNNNQPRAYKRQSIYRDPDQKYFVDYSNGHYTIVDSTQSNDYRIVYNRSRKYVPIFFPEFFSVFGLATSDYDYYFDRSYDAGSIHYANGQVLGNEIFAENGFIYKMDQVVEPLKNVEQILVEENSENSYNYITDLLRMFPDFDPDLDETRNQPAAKAGLNYDTLFILNYPDLPFNAHDELTGPEQYTLRYHYGFLAPNDVAYERFINEILTDGSGYPHWGSYESVPREVKRIIIKNHMSDNAVYQSDMQSGFYTGEGDLVRLGDDQVVQKYYGSNATFLGLNEVVVPRAFTSVSGPVYLRPGFSTLLYGIEYSNVLPAIKKELAEYSFFILNDNTLLEDSSLLKYWIDKKANRYDMRAFDRGNEKMSKMSSQLLAKRILNQIGTSVPNQSANKEFIENLAGNFIVFDNLNQTVRGGVESKYGYSGDSIIELTPLELDEPADNGKTYHVEGWFYPANYDLYTALTSRGKFIELMTKAGMYNDKTYSFNFNTEGENYTIFIPSDSALTANEADTLSPEELELFLSYHFVRGDRIFTDGKTGSGNYQTLRKDESSTSLFTKFTSLELGTGADYIEIFDLEGTLLGRIEEEEGKTNIMVTFEVDNDLPASFGNITTSVIHDINFAIHK